MTTKSPDVLDRVPSGRFVRNLALSLSGGALLTLIGAGVAHADDASTASAGTGAAGTGDATAVGNRSGTQATQGTAASTSGANIQIINQNAGVANVGVGVANTGGNVAVGNASKSTANAGQVSNGGPLGLAVNNGNASNASDGGALISTGDAYAIGNESNTSISQHADASAHGTLGGVLVLSQDALVVNAGLGLANTGINGTVGNASGALAPGPGNSSGILQNALNDSGGLGGATNTGSASNDSNGKATISTGNASATGNRADTKVSQIAGSGDGGGPDPSGLTVITQLGGALNAGAGIANTGVNGAVGNASLNLAQVGVPLLLPQDAGVDVEGAGLANNDASATNASDGTAWIATGDATVIGNDSRTAIIQDADAVFGDQGVNIQTQLAPVVNLGLGVANTGVNGAVGNVSQNQATVTQSVGTFDGADANPLALGIATNSGEAANSSNGSASIHTGDAWAQGNHSGTDVWQSTEADGTALAVQTQVELVANVGVGVANTGVNGAIGNVSQNQSDLDQGGGVNIGGGFLGLVTASDSGSASDDSDGTASITTGDAWASGNESTTEVSQALDPTGMAVQTQAALVLNAGLGASSTGINGAVGNASDNADGNGAILTQSAVVDPTVLIAGVATVSNQGDASNTSDGTALITTGDAWSAGNHSRTTLTQEANASVDGLGAAVNTQLGVVANVGVGVANSGVNGAVGNRSANRVEADQDNIVDGASFTTGVLTASNSGSATNATDGTAIIATGDATARGNQSATDFDQTANASVPGLGIVVNTQAGGVVNAGAGIANTGGNVALGNISDSEALVTQDALLGSHLGPGGLTLVAPVATNANQVDATNASGGTGEIRTGRAEATGNSSDTRFEQATDGSVDGLGAVVNSQVGGVANVGLAIANSGVNAAVGNFSNNDTGDFGPDIPGLSQLAAIGGNGNASDVNVPLGPITNGNFGSATNSSDGHAAIDTGDTKAQGNVSATDFSQEMRGSVSEGGLGIVPNLQVGGVLNLGVGIANSGVNVAVGNASGSGLLPPLFPLPNLLDENQVTVGQQTDVQEQSGEDLAVLTGALTNTNTAEVGNDSDGTAKVFTGDALATGNVSTSNFSQKVDGIVDGLGLVVGPQLGVIANVGIGVANSGINGSIGNLSNNSATTEIGAQFAEFDTNDPAVALSGVTVGNNASYTNSSDGEACVCTGNAVATGNVSTSTLPQDLEIGVDDGLSVVPMTGVILNAGFGLANSGVNAAIGNWSQNRAAAVQEAALDPDAGIDLGGTQLLVGPQTIVNGGGADNTSAGTGKVGTGNARADGNISTSGLTQAVQVDGAGAFASVNGGIGNVGAGVANSGVNLGLGNVSANRSRLAQNATGEGTVANQGRASNSSDGFGGVGDPNCDVPGETTPGTPGLPGLPKTGGPLEIEAALGLMMLLAGFGFRRVGQAAAKRS